MHFTNSDLDIKLKDLKEGFYSTNIFSIYFSKRPFYSFSIHLKNCNNLFSFTCYKLNSEWVFGMTYTNFHSHRLFIKYFNEDEKLYNVIIYTESILKKLKEELNTNLEE